jgi:hypothetical protein
MRQQLFETDALSCSSDVGDLDFAPYSLFSVNAAGRRELRKGDIHYSP